MTSLWWKIQPTSNISQKLHHLTYNKQIRNRIFYRFIGNNNMKDPFRILGISRSSTAVEAKKAYYQLVKEYHPDKNPSYISKFKDIQWAYEKVKEYHKTGNIPGRNTYVNNPYNTGKSNDPRTNTSTNSSNRSDTYGRTYTQTNFDPNRYKNWTDTSSTFKDAEDYIWFVKKTFESDFFKNADIFNTSTNRNRYSTTTTTNNEYHPKQSKMDIHKITITFVESCLGCFKTIQARTCFHCNGTGVKGYTEVICSDCDGRGSLRVSQGPIHMVIPCPTCNRYGRIKKPNICSSCDGLGTFVVSKQFKIKIPSGVNDGEFIDVNCDGYIHKVQIKVTPSSIFTRKANNVHSDIEIDYIQALMGDNIIVPTIHGDVCVKIPPGTSSHSIIRIPGKGINGNAHIIHIKIHIPQSSNTKTSGIISQLAQLRGYNLSWTQPSNHSSAIGTYDLNYLKNKVILLFEKFGINVSFFINLYKKMLPK